MKFTSMILATLMASTSATKIYTSAADATNAEKYWGNDAEKYRATLDASGDANNCKIYESRNWKGAQQCDHSWECRGARTCERGGWCSGYDGCEGTPFPYQAPGLAADC